MSQLLRSKIRISRLIILAVLVAGDVGTTVFGQYMLGERFVELGGLAGHYIKRFGDLWYLHYYPVELAIFGVTTILTIAVWPGKKFNLGILRIGMWQITYAMLIFLIVNNIVQSTIIHYFAEFFY